MGTYVLVHGALGGGWQFAQVARSLRRDGHQVFTPTLTGVGERAHLASVDVGLDTHVRDVSAIVEYEGLTDTVLVGTGYGGVVITAAAEELGERVSGLVYVDALVPVDGRSTMDLLPPAFRDCVRTLVREHDGWRIPPGEHVLKLWGISDPSLREWIAGRLTAFPIRCLEQPVRLPGGRGRVRRDYIELTPTDPNLFASCAAQAMAEGWGFHRLQTDQAAWFDSPALLAGLLQLCALSTHSDAGAAVAAAGRPAP
ncbi:MAG: alpha/beta fold hydrolase [Sporichthyaceae bacterium]